MDYLRENKDKSFMELPFSIPDAMLLANAIYMRFKGLVPENGNTVTFGDIDRVMDKNKVFAHPLYGPVYRRIFEEMKDSRRYSKIRLVCPLWKRPGVPPWRKRPRPSVC